MATILRLIRWGRPHVGFQEWSSCDYS